MVNKQLLMNEFKLKTLRMMTTENRISLDVRNINYWNNYIIPEPLKQIIDKTYRELSEIANGNGIATTTVEELIEGKRNETNIEAQGLYKKKTIEQMNKIQVELRRIKENIENETIKLQEQKESIEEQMKDEKNNALITERLCKNIVSSIQSIQNRMCVELLGKTNPMEAERKIQKLTSEIMYSVRRAKLQENINQALNVDDKRVALKINKELENAMEYINKTDRERFVDSVKIEDTPKISDDFFEKQEEKEKEHSLGWLDSDIIK